MTVAPVAFKVNVLVPVEVIDDAPLKLRVGVVPEIVYAEKLRMLLVLVVVIPAAVIVPPD